MLKTQQITYGLHMTSQKYAVWNLSNSNLANFDDLLRVFRFVPKEGRIWIHDHRGLLLSTAAIGTLRSEIMERLGTDAAREIFGRFAYSDGARDAAAARKLRPNETPNWVFAAGPQAAALYGLAWCEVVTLEMEPEKGRYSFDFRLHNSVEADIHLEKFGPSVEPVCWMSCGYASGFSSAFAGGPYLVRETECRAMGAPACRLVGKPLNEWRGEDVSTDARLYQSDPRINRFDGAKGQVKEADVIGISAGFSSAYHLLSKAAPSKATLLFLGETGVGKEVFARLAHRISPRRNMPFVAVNCGALPDSLIESELFGVVRGGFTGAHASRPGRFERAEGGTLFLDEIATLSLSAQAKLLRALQEGEIERVGDTHTRKVDVRVLAATNVDLREAMRKGEFREDLYYRIATFPITIPPLRERRDDVPLLMEHFRQRYCERHEKSVPGFTNRAVEALLVHDLPGNIRELEHRIEGAVLLSTDGEPLDIPHLFPAGDAALGTMLGVTRRGLLSQQKSGEIKRHVADLLDATGQGAEAFETIEREILEATVVRNGGNLAAAARALGLTRRQLSLRLEKLRATNR